MVTLRHFGAADAAALRENMYSGMTEDEICRLIEDWNSLEYRGKYFEMFAIEEDGALAGTISLYHHSESAVSLGPEVFPGYRGRGIGKAAMRSAMEKARERGYRLILQQVRCDNAPSIALHKSLGFETDGCGYKNRRGHDVLLFWKLLPSEDGNSPGRV